MKSRFVIGTDMHRASFITIISTLFYFLAAVIPGGVASAASVEKSNTTPHKFADPSLPVETRLSDLLKQMTTEEKIHTLVSGFDYNSIPRLGIPAVHCADGPLGIASWGLRGRATAFPATIALAASWNTILAREAGAAFAREWRARGLNVFYGPGVNLYRASKASRNFEYLGEDPYLTAEMAVPFTRALQQGGVMAVVKHFAGNEQEFDRYLVDTRADERTLRELYLRPFEELIRRADAKGVMMAYNLLNGTYCAQNRWLIDILRHEWGFRGTVMSDWGATHACEQAIRAGLDMELGSADHLVAPNILPLMEEGKISVQELDSMVAHIYRPIMELGIFDRIAEPDTTLTLFSPANNKVASRMAEEGIVLLRNRCSLLPLSPDSIRTIAVIGPNASPVMVDDRIHNVSHSLHGGGGSSKVNPFTFISPLQGVINEFPDTEILYSEGVSNAYLERLFDRTGVVNFIGHTEYIDVEGKPDTTLSVWNTMIIPDRTEPLNLFVRAQGGWRITVNDSIVVDRLSAPGFSDGMSQIEGRMAEPINIKIEYRANNANPREMRFGWDYASGLDFSEALRIARKADAVLFCGGFDSALEFEGTDRPFELPYGQSQLIAALARVNPNLIVALNGGGAMATAEWETEVPAILWTSYPGQDGGRALAGILSGRINPSGKLPFSWERRWEDSPAFGSYDEQRHRRFVEYTEGIMTGYRSFDHYAVAPLFPFGHGLSYSTFEYSGIEVAPDPAAGKNCFSVSFSVTNSSAVPGQEVAQLYISYPEGKEIHPLKELKGFGKILLAPGESKRITLPLTSEHFRYFSADEHRWLVPSGRYTVHVGPSSALLPLSTSLQVK